MSCESLNETHSSIIDFTVVVGMAISKMKEMLLLQNAFNTWLKPRKWMTYFAMIPCDKHFVFPQFIEFRCTPNSIWNYHTGNFMVLAELLEYMYSSLPRHEFYLKVDADTIIVPLNLARFLKASPNVQYFGSTDVTYKNVKVLGVKNRFNYIQGGFEGYSYRSIHTIVDKECIKQIGTPNCTTTDCLNKREDITAGACAFIHGIRLTHCKCFFPWGPCDINRPSTCTDKVCANTISVHKLKRKDWYMKWWG